MTILVIILNIILWSGVAYCVYLFLKEPREITFSFLRYIKSAKYPIAIILFPLWGIAWLLDKKFKWGIYTEEDSTEDLHYETEEELQIDFSRYDKFIEISNMNEKEIEESIQVAAETGQLNKKYCTFNFIQTSHKIILQFNNAISFFDFHFLIQWLLADKEEDVIGIGIHNTTKSLSYFVMNDNTDKHINSLVGETLNGKRFSINLTDDFEKAEYLSLNSKISLPLQYDVESFIKRQSIIIN